MPIRQMAIAAALAAGLAAVPVSAAQAQYFPPCSPFPLFWPFCAAGAVVGTAATIVTASNFSTDQRRAKLFLDRVDADLVANQLRRMYPRLAQDIEVTSVQPTALIYSSDRRSRVAMI